ncbi:MAG: shikimate kinase [Syntrophales bacterium]|nr:shikimate kinase [Syntrophales bacterium]
MEKIFLIGYRCTGKTSVGRKLAEKLDVSFFDSDELVVERAGCSICDIVSRWGWPYFRTLEKEVVKYLAKVQGPGVVALGGGSVMDEENVDALRGKGFFVWLYADVNTIVSRMIKDKKTSSTRPSLTGDDVYGETQQVLSIREGVYRSIMDAKIDTRGKELERVVDEIIWEREKWRVTRLDSCSK